MATPPPTVTLGARVDIPLARPRPIEQQALYLPPDFSTAIGVAHGIAALRMCWPPDVAWPILQRPPSWRLRDRIEEYGAAIYDALVRAGVDEGQVVKASTVALRYALGLPQEADVKAGAADEPDLITQSDVDAAQGFSEPPAAPASAGG